MNESESDPPDWPYRSLVILGFWRPTSRAGKRLMLHSAVALLLFLGGFAGTQVLDAASWTRLSAALIPLAVLVIIRANVVYLRSLDSLEKLIQLTAFSAAYGAALFIGFFLFALDTATATVVSPLWLLLAEPFRGVMLFVASRKYQ